MYIRRKVFSVVNDLGLEERMYGAKSKILGFVAPGAWQAKEAEKYLHEDEDDYKKKRLGTAILGAFTPGTATITKKQLEKMHNEGKTPEEMREWMKKTKNKRIAAGIGEVALGALTSGVSSSLANMGATGVGIVDTLDKENSRKSFKKSKKD